MTVYCYKECVTKVAACLLGSAGPCRVESKMLKHWLLHLREAMATWVDWLRNSSPPYTVYHAVDTVHTVALNKTLGMRPLEVGEVWMCL
jgi:hypothetical protein